MRENQQIIRSVKIILLVLYVVGMIGFMIEETYPVFVRLTPFHLLFSLTILLIFQQKWSLKIGSSLLAITLIGFGVEWLGINTQSLFGHYVYGSALGLKLGGTPLLIGVNWLILSYGVYVLCRRIVDRWFFPFVGAGLMLAFDVVMEPVATTLDMWRWEAEQIPMKNYLDWYLVSLFIFSGMRALRLDLSNRIAVWILFLQGVFFIGLNVALRLTQWEFL